MWLTYSVNKEDIWVSRVPLPVKTTWEGPVSDDLTRLEPMAPVPNWNIYRSTWAPVYIGEERSGLWLSDRDPYDYARAIRIFQETRQAALTLTMAVEKEGQDPIEVDVTDRHGTRAVSLVVKGGAVSARQADGQTTPVATYQTGKPFSININVDADNGKSTVNGTALQTMHAVKSIERLSVRTGEYRNLPDRNTPNQDRMPPLEGCDEPVEETALRLLSLTCQ